ncbi:hypothetical protein CK203_029187 [Vitis vinifera]|uniref:Uncharacterized protein n=1 Tax=Vitis vinifera TaxID=29760 RepID=A0A438ISM8_VITVI|nr:hypothetical protein CK203_029187 [Vitis vinifera]
MGEAPAAGTMDLDTIRSRMSELNRIHTNYSHISDSNPLDSRSLFQEFSHHLQSRVNQILSQYSDVESLEADDLDAYLGHLKKELNLVESENAKISNEIEALTRTYVEDSNQLESDLEVLKHSVDFVASQIERYSEMDWLIEMCSIVFPRIHRGDTRGREESRVCCLSRFWKGGVGMVVGAFEESYGVGGFQGRRLKILRRERAFIEVVGPMQMWLQRKDLGTELCCQLENGSEL